MHLKFIFMSVTMVHKGQGLVFVSGGGVRGTSHDPFLSARVKEDSVSVGRGCGTEGRSGRVS